MKLGQVIKLVNEKIDTSFLSKEEYVSTENMIPNFGGIRFATNIPQCKCTKFRNRDVLISNIRPYFKKVWFAKFNGGCSADVLVLRGSVLIEPRYLYYIVANEKFISYYNSSCKGTKMPRGNKDALLEYEVALPTLQVQQHIVNTIGSVDDLIEKYQSILTKVDEIINLLFLNLEPSELRLADIADIKYGKGLEASKLTQNKQYPVYGSNGIIGTLDTYDFETPKIAISCRGASSGNVFLTKPYSSISSNSLYLNFKNNDNMLPIYSYLRRIGLSSFATGSAQPQITIENLQHLNVPNLKNCSTNHDKLIELWFEIQYKIDLAKKVKEILLNKYF